MDVLKANLKVVGQLIKYYRKKLDLSRKDISAKNPLISISSIQRAEEGGYVSNDKMNLILEVFGLELSTDKLKYLTLERYIKETYSIINCGKPLVEYGVLKHKINDFSKENKQYIYLSELSLMCTLALDLYLSSRVEDKEIMDTTTYIYESLKDNKYLYLIATYALNMYHSYYLVFLEYEQFDYGQILENNKLFYLDGFHYDITHLNSFELYAKYNDMKLEEKNIYKKFINYCAKAFINVSINEKTESEIYLPKVKELYDKYNDIIPNRFLYHYYEMEAIFNLNQKNYKKSFEYSYLIYKNYDKIIDYSYLTLFRSLEKLGKTKSITKILNDKKDNPKKINNDIFEYYESKHIKKFDNAKLQKMICDLFCFRNNKSYFIFNFFLEELLDLCEDNNSYIFVYKFIKSNNIAIKDIGLLK